MGKNQLENMHWLLLVSKETLRYASQRKKWNELVNQFRKANKGLNKVPDHIGHLLSLTDGVYQD